MEYFMNKLLHNNQFLLVGGVGLKSCDAVWNIEHWIRFFSFFIYWYFFLFYALHERGSYFGNDKSDPCIAKLRKRNDIIVLLVIVFQQTDDRLFDSFLWGWISTTHTTFLRAQRMHFLAHEIEHHPFPILIEHATNSYRIKVCAVSTLSFKESNRLHAQCTFQQAMANQVLSFINSWRSEP